MAAQIGANSKPGSALADTYARALFVLAEESGKLDDVAQELRDLVAIVEDQPALAALLTHKVINLKRRGASIRRIFEGRVSDLVLRFLMVLNDKGRLGQLAPISDGFDALLKHKRNQVDVEVFTARPLNEQAAEKVAAQVSKMLGRTAILHEHTDPSLIGGLKIRVGDKLIDASVAARLRSLQSRLVDRGHDLVRTAGQLLQK